MATTHNDSSNPNNNENTDHIENTELENENQRSSGKFDSLTHIKHLSGMYRNWFLDYASYVILERAVPYLYDGFKPVQRRILHAMNRMHDGRYHKVANIIGHAMQFHPHGDASIGEALIQLGQKNVLIDTQGNWGNNLTGDSAAAPRYIEARLSKFAKEVVFNHKTTTWKDSYDGRNKEPESLPVKFPLLLVQGVEGIAVGLASKILPHNFNELIDAAIKHLKGETFELLPDFPSGGQADFSRYKDGQRGGKVRVRAKIDKVDKSTLAIRELPFGKTTNSLIDSIINANEKKKIKIKKVDDNTAEHVEILVHLRNGASPDKTIDALYAFTDCEISISPNACVIDDEKPRFLGVSDILKFSVDNTLKLLQQELQIRKNELEEDWHASSLEKIFIENKIYSHIEQCETWECILTTIDNKLEPFKKLLKRDVTHDDLVKLTEIRIKRISKYDSNKAEKHIKKIEEEIESINHKLNTIVDYTINYFQNLKDEYGSYYPRQTEIKNFDTIEASNVAVNSEKLYVNREEGFIGTNLKNAEYVTDCSDIDDIIIFRRDGKYLVTRVAPKVFVGKDIIHAAIFKKNDDRTIYNTLYLDGETGYTIMKRFAVTSVTREKEYDVTQGTPRSKILYFSANPNGEAEIVKVALTPKPRLKKPILYCDFGEISVKGRFARGNIFTKHAIYRITLKKRGESTLGGTDIWFDYSVLRLNTEERGKYLGEFSGEDKIIAFMQSGYYMLYSYDLTTHFEDDLVLIDKFDSSKVYTAAFFEAEQGFFYLKRFKPEYTIRPASFIGENENSYLVALSNEKYPRFEISFKGDDSHREPQVVEGWNFVGLKSYKARGKRLTNCDVDRINEVEPAEVTEEFTDQDSGIEDSANGEDDYPDDQKVQSSLFNE